MSIGNIFGRENNRPQFSPQCNDIDQTKMYRTLCGEEFRL